MIKQSGHTIFKTNVSLSSPSCIYFPYENDIKSSTSVLNSQQEKKYILVYKTQISLKFLSRAKPQPCVYFAEKFCVKSANPRI